MMGRHALCIVALLVSLAGCRAARVPQPLTALEAYAQVQSAMMAWQEDAVVTRVASLNAKEPEGRVDADGQAVQWGFGVVSTGAQKETTILLKRGRARVGMPDIPGGEIMTSGPEEALPLDRMLDSDAAVQIAIENGAHGTLYEITTTRRGGKGERLPPSWILNYGHRYDWAQQHYVIIDAVTGEVYYNDFAE